MQKSFLRETTDVVVKAVVVTLTFVAVIVAVSSLYESESEIGDGSCNIAVLPIEGTILPYHGIGNFEMIITPEVVESFFDTVENQGGIDGVMLEINSPGGTPVASERISQRLRSTSLPVVGLVGDIAASGGYMIAAASDYIIASPMSTVGSIGVTMSYLEESEKNKEEGITYVQLTSGKFKDAGSPNRPITDEERMLFMDDLELVHDIFVDMVADYRNLDRGEVDALADGSTMPGVRAIDNGLVDELGSREDARKFFANLLEKDIKDINFCEYDRGFLPF